jgi:dephospho-CoA kinase
MTYCVGLTGGIGSGKSSAARLFADCGAAVVDTDDVSHELTRPGGGALAALRAAFGPDCLAADGGLDRARMRRLAFADESVRRRLESVLHPLIRAETHRRVAAARADYVVVVVPLLFETGAYADLVRRVAVVDCPEELQIARAMQRSRLDEAEVRAIIAAQLPRQARLARADDVLRNDDDIASLRAQVAALHERYRALARAADSRNS